LSVSINLRWATERKGNVIAKVVYTGGWGGRKAIELRSTDSRGSCPYMSVARAFPAPFPIK